MPPIKVLNLAMRLGFMIALPIVFLAFMGRMLDKAYGSSPVFILAGIGLSLMITTFLVYKEIVSINSKSD